MTKLVALLLASIPVLAQSGELWVSGGESILSSRGIGSFSPAGSPNDVQLDNGFRLGFRFAFNSPTRFGHEIQYAYNRTHLTANGLDLGGMAIHQGGYNFLFYGTKEGGRIRPFATGGVHFSNYVPPGSSATYGGGSTKFGLNYGGGVKFRVSGIWALRLDVREYETPKPDFGLYLRQGWLSQLEVSAGVGIVF